MKFKSLTMRIWVTFTAVILMIISIISLLYFIAFRVADENAKIQDLHVAHNILLNSDFSEPIRFGELQNLRGSVHFIYSDNKIHEIGKMPGRMLPPSGPNNENGKPRHENFDNISTKQWLAEFAQGELSEKRFKESHAGVRFIFVISSTADGYLISYMPNLYNDSSFYFILLVGGIFILLGLLVAKLVANYISKPLKELEGFTKRVAAKNFEQPIEISNQDEIGRLAQSMNKMQENLKRAEEEEKSFLQSISHDLKTPVMVIMSHADAIIDGVYVESAENTAQIIKDEAIGLGRKIKQLLYFNTLDYVLDNQREKSELDLGAVITRTVDRLKAAGGNLHWACDIESVKIIGNSEKLTVAVENILDNALRYAKTQIRVSLNRQGKYAHLEIFNDGGQIEPESIDKIFDNFYKDKSGNFGLGLAITKKIITHFGGSVKAVNRENGVSFVMDIEIT